MESWLVVLNFSGSCFPLVKQQVPSRKTGWKAAITCFQLKTLKSSLCLKSASEGRRVHQKLTIKNENLLKETGSWFPAQTGSRASFTVSKKTGSKLAESNMWMNRPVLPQRTWFNNQHSKLQVPAASHGAPKGRHGPSGPAGQLVWRSKIQLFPVD